MDSEYAKQQAELKRRRKAQRKRMAQRAKKLAGDPARQARAEAMKDPRFADFTNAPFGKHRWRGLSGH